MRTHPLLYAYYLKNKCVFLKSLQFKNLKCACVALFVLMKTYERMRTSESYCLIVLLTENIGNKKCRNSKSISKKIGDHNQSVKCVN